jgi:hypothetical protein
LPQLQKAPKWKNDRKKICISKTKKALTINYKSITHDNFISIEAIRSVLLFLSWYPLLKF